MIIDMLIWIPITFIVSVLGVSAYKCYSEENAKKAKRKCRLDKYNK